MFLMGSFTDGMFKGAQSAMGIYTGIQGILAAQDSAALSKKVEEQRQKELSDQKGMTQADTAIGELQASRAPPAAPAAPAAAPVTGAVGGDKPLGTTPASTTTPKPADTVATPSGITSAGGDAAERARDAAKAMAIMPIIRAGNSSPTVAGGAYDSGQSGLGLPLPQYNPPAPINPPAQAPMSSETAPVGRPAIPAASPGWGRPPQYQSNVPAQAPMSSERPMPAQAVGAPVGPTFGQQQPPEPPATYTPPSVTQPVGGYLTGRNPPGTIPATSGRPAATPPAQAPAPPPPNTGARPAPVADAGTGVGSRFSSLLAQVNPIGTAHAEPAGGDVNAPQPGDTPHPPDTRGAVGGDQTMGVGGAPTSPIAGATIQDAPLPGQPGANVPPDAKLSPSAQRVTEVTPPAVPPKPDPSGKVTPGPVTVKTAEGQTVTQSETPTISMAPPVSGWYGRELERVDPGLARLTHQLVDQLGANAVTYDQVAAHMYRESKFKSGLTGPFGEHGVMQVMPDTGAWLERNILHRQVDHNSPEGSLTLGITYLRYLANDLHLGGNTIQTNLAYMRGPGAVRQVNQIGLEASQRGEGKYNLKNALGWTDDMYRTNGPGSDSAIKLDREQFQGGALNENHVNVTPQGAMQAAAQGPEGTLNYIASTGSPGLGMSELWIQYQGALERQAIWSGHLDMLPHIADFVLQQSHQGALSNLAAADAALASGNIQGAASAIARAHAFFPDGSYAQIGVDGKGNLYGQQFSENTHQALGKPMAITRDMIQAQMMALGNPHDYVKALDAHRKINSDIDFQKAHGDYFRALPGIKEAQIEGQNQRAADKAAADEQRRQDTWKHQQEVKATEEKNTNDIDKSLETKYDPAANPGVSPQELATRSEIERQLRVPTSMGGAHIGGPRAYEIAEGMVGTKPRYTMNRMEGKKGTPNEGKTVYQIVDKDGKEAAVLGAPAGAQIVRLPGLGTRSPLQNPPPNPQKQAMGVGAGAGSPQAQQQGFNQNLAGVPTIPMQQQPQQTAIG